MQVFFLLLIFSLASNSIAEKPYIGVPPTNKPTFNCSAKNLHQVEAAICSDPELAKLDRELGDIYKQALVLDKKVVGGNLAADQRGWVSGRNDCWKDKELKKCATDAYDRRISELQAKYRLVKPSSTISYACDNNPANELVVNYFTTKIKIAVAERGDSTFYLYDDSEGGAGKHYLGRNETLTIKEGTVEFVPAYEAPALVCRPAKGKK